MQKALKLNIISEGQKYGVSVTCKKYNISRTIYYRWLKRYQSLGIDGLDDIKKNCEPVNKTDIRVEKAVLNLIRFYPNYGPRAIKYLLEEIGYKISESAVFNIMKRNNLTNKDSRIRFAKKKSDKITNTVLTLNELHSGECWLFWIIDYGSFESVGQIFEYTIFDFKSKIACSRLYNEISYEHFEDLLTAVALPIAQSIKLNPKYLCLFKDCKLFKQAKKNDQSNITKTIEANGFDIGIHRLNNEDDLTKILELRTSYTKGCISFLIPLINLGLSIDELKIQFQKHVRAYNTEDKSLYDTMKYCPIEYHSTSTSTKPILPIWVYIDRQY